MTFKKGDRVRTEDGDLGEILFVDKGGVEAQVALERISMKLRTDTLEKVSPEAVPVPAAAPRKATARPKRARARRAPQS